MYIHTKKGQSQILLLLLLCIMYYVLSTNYNYPTAPRSPIFLDVFNKFKYKYCT